MSSLFEVRPSDILFYQQNLRDFLPPKMIDIHTHIWLQRFKTSRAVYNSRTVLWPSLVAAENPLEDLLETYDLMFPGKTVTPLLFGQPTDDIDLELNNQYVRECAQQHHFPALILATPAWSGSDLKRRILDGGFIGAKVYLNYAPGYIPRAEIRIFDFLTPDQLGELNRLKAVVMLHIARDKRLRDPVNIAQILEITERFPDVRLIIAHVGRAYCIEDLGHALKELAPAENLLFDISANCNPVVFERLIEAVGPRRILFGSDMPILRMRTRRICEDGQYINLVPRGLYGDVSVDPHMREIDNELADGLTFFMYEEIDAFRRAAIKQGLSAADIEDVFYHNARRLIEIG